MCVHLQADLRQYSKDLHSLSSFTALHGWPVLSCSASQHLPASQFNWWNIRQPRTWQPAGQFRLRNRLLAKSFKQSRQQWIVCTSSTLPAMFVFGLPKSMNNQNCYIQTQKQSELCNLIEPFREYSHNADWQNAHCISSHLEDFGGNLLKICTPFGWKQWLEKGQRGNSFHWLVQSDFFWIPVRWLIENSFTCLNEINKLIMYKRLFSFRKDFATLLSGIRCSVYFNTEYRKCFC